MLASSMKAASDHAPMDIGVGVGRKNTMCRRSNLMESKTRKQAPKQTRAKPASSPGKMRCLKRGKAWGLKRRKKLSRTNTTKAAPAPIPEKNRYHMMFSPNTVNTALPTKRD
jgi:hypothetical protein